MKRIFDIRHFDLAVLNEEAKTCETELIHRAEQGYRKNIDSIVAVSYTHLDVYKRQVLYKRYAFGTGDQSKGNP